MKWPISWAGKKWKEKRDGWQLRYMSSSFMSFENIDLFERKTNDSQTNLTYPSSLLDRFTPNSHPYTHVYSTAPL